MKKLVLAATHLGAALAGFAAGIYLLPILIAPEAPDITAIESAQTSGPRFGRASIEIEKTVTYSTGVKVLLKFLTMSLFLKGKWLPDLIIGCI